MKFKVGDNVMIKAGCPPKTALDVSDISHNPYGKIGKVTQILEESEWPYQVRWSNNIKNIYKEEWLVRAGSLREWNRESI